jgi:hypothetical protein
MNPSGDRQVYPANNCQLAFCRPLQPYQQQSPLKWWSRREALNSIGVDYAIVGYHVRNVVLHSATMFSYNRGVCSPAPDVLLGQAGVGGRTYLDRQIG